mgnify:CR=1 FL=1
MAGSRFSLPATFDSKKFASKWVEDGPEIEEARQPQVIADARVQAAGWEVFKTLNLEAAKNDSGEDAKKSPKLIPVVRVVGKRKFVLMFRPLQLQRAVNQIYSNQSRDRVNREIVGESKVVGDDPGVLTNQDLQRVSRSYGEDAPTPIPKGVGSVQDPNRASELALQ